MCGCSDRMGLVAALQVILFGGGLSAELIGGMISNASAGMLVAVLANSSLTVDNVVFTENFVRRAIIFGKSAVACQGPYGRVTGPWPWCTHVGLSGPVCLNSCFCTT